MELNKKESLKDKLDKIEEDYKKDLRALKKRFILEKMKMLLTIGFQIAYLIIIAILLMNPMYYEVGIILFIIWIISLIGVFTAREWVEEYNERKMELFRDKSDYTSRVIYQDNYDDCW